MVPVVRQPVAPGHIFNNYPKPGSYLDCTTASGGPGPRVRDAYYRGMFPLVPFVLVLALIGLQLLPLVIGATLYNIAVTNGICGQFVPADRSGALHQRLLWRSSSAGWRRPQWRFTLLRWPDMTLGRALKSAKDLVMRAGRLY